MLVAHISDLHLGKKSPGDPQGAVRLNSFRQALTELSQSRAQVLLIAGDMFDSPQVEPAVIDEAARSLVALGEELPVVVIPGNHDPTEADVLWTAFQKSVGAAVHVHVIREAAVIPLAEGKLLIEAYPCPTRFSSEAPWEQRLQAGAAGALRVIMAHGTLQGGPVPEGETDAYPFTKAQLEALGADYVALGHFHGVYPAWGNGEVCHRSYCYCGTHEPDQFGGDAGYAILATLSVGQPARLQRIKVGRRQWREVWLAGPAALSEVDSLLNEVKTSTEPGRFVIRLRVQSGAGWSLGDVERLETLEAGLLALGAQVERRGIIEPRVDVDALDLQSLPTGAVKEALLSLQSELEQSKDNDPASRAILRAALEIGWDKVQEAARS